MHVMHRHTTVCIAPLQGDGYYCLRPVVHVGVNSGLQPCRACCLNLMRLVNSAVNPGIVLSMNWRQLGFLGRASVYHVHCESCRLCSFSKMCRKPRDFAKLDIEIHNFHMWAAFPTLYSEISVWFSDSTNWVKCIFRFYGSVTCTTKR